MTFQDIASIAGKPGLYKILKPTRTGVIVESLQEKPVKFAVDANQRLSILSEVSVYIAGSAEESVPLVTVLRNIKKEYGNTLEVDTKDNTELLAFFKTVLPDYDKSKVYGSDVRKIVQWYQCIIKFAPEILEESVTESSEILSEQPTQILEATQQTASQTVTSEKSEIESVSLTQDDAKPKKKKTSANKA